MLGVILDCDLRWVVMEVSPQPHRYGGPDVIGQAVRYVLELGILSF